MIMDNQLISFQTLTVKLILYPCYIIKVIFDVMRIPYQIQFSGSVQVALHGLGHHRIRLLAKCICTVSHHF